MVFSTENKNVSLHFEVIVFFFLGERLLEIVLERLVEIVAYIFLGPPLNRVAVLYMSILKQEAGAAMT